MCGNGAGGEAEGTERPAGSGADRSCSRNNLKRPSKNDSAPKHTGKSGVRCRAEKSAARLLCRLFQRRRPSKIQWLSAAEFSTKLSTRDDAIQRRARLTDFKYTLNLACRCRRGLAADRCARRPVRRQLTSPASLTMWRALFGAKPSAASPPQSRVAPPPQEDPATARFSLRHLQALYAALMREKAAHPTPASDAALIETIKQISEFMVYGDKHDDKFFECVVVPIGGADLQVHSTLLAVRGCLLQKSPHACCWGNRCRVAWARFRLVLVWKRNHRTVWSLFPVAPSEPLADATLQVLAGERKRIA